MWFSENSENSKTGFAVGRGGLGSPRCIRLLAMTQRPSGRHGERGLPLSWYNVEEEHVERRGLMTEYSALTRTESLVGSPSKYEGVGGHGKELDATQRSRSCFVLGVNAFPSQCVSRKWPGLSNVFRMVVAAELRVFVVMSSFWWSGWPDLNRRPRAPKARALTRLRYTPTDFFIALPVSEGKRALR